jgi:hypothetical protein
MIGSDQRDGALDDQIEQSAEIELAGDLRGDGLDRFEPVGVVELARAVRRDVQIAPAVVRRDFGHRATSLPSTIVIGHRGGCHVQDSYRTKSELTTAKCSC